MRTLPVLIAAALLTGCAAVSVQRGKDVSSAGIAYSQAVQDVVDAAIDASIDASSLTRQAETAMRPGPPTPDERTARAGRLQESDEQLIASTSTYLRLKRSVSAVEASFIALQALADGSTSEATSTAVANLADRVNGINAALGRSAALSDAQKSAVAGLSALVAEQVHGAAVARALKRDAPIIGTALALQQRLLDAAADDIRSELSAASTVFYRDRVLVPYAAGRMGEAWPDDRRTYIKARAMGATSEALSSAQAAAAQMQTVWARIVSGETSASELAVMLQETRDLLAALAAVKAAGRP